MDHTVIVAEEGAARELFAHRLLAAAYSKRQPTLNSRRRQVIRLERPRPRLEAVQAAAPNAAADAREKLRTDLVPEQQASDRTAEDLFECHVSLPARLLPEEAATAVRHGLVRLQRAAGAPLWTAVTGDGDGDGDGDGRDGWVFPRSRGEWLQWRVFDDLWRKGWILTRGLSFGCDWMLYTSDPGTTHSTFTVCVTDEAEELQPADMVQWMAMSALATKVRKAALLASVEGEPESGPVHYMLLEGCLFRRQDYLRGKALEELALKEEEEAEARRKQREDPLHFPAAGPDESGSQTSVTV